MKKTYEYMHVVSAMDSIDIEDISQCDIKAYNDLGQAWYLHVATALGQTKIIEFGPFIENEVHEENFFFRKTIKEYKEKWVDSVINNFIDNPKRAITQVFIIDQEELYNQLDTLKQQLN